jgi:plasmid stabilization system protein ParE
MKYRVSLTGRAARDIDEALARLCGQGAVSAASRWYVRLMAAFATLEREPQRCPIAPESEEIGIELRELHFGRRRGVYRILFTIEERAVNVVHIRHSARDTLRPDDLI